MSYFEGIAPSLAPLVLLSGFGCAALIGAKRSSSSLRRLMASAFLLSLLVALATPWMHWPGAGSAASISELPFTDVERAAANAARRAEDIWPWQWLAFVPALVVGIRHVLGVMALTWAKRRFQPGPEGLTADRLYVCRKAPTAYAFGWLRPSIVLPASYLNLDAAELVAIIRHEEAHLRQGDPTLIPVVNFLQGLLWWNPFVHLLGHAWRVESERAADDAALASGIPPKRYARQLIDLAQGLAGRPPLAGSAFVGRGRLKSRILAVVNPEIRRKSMKVSHKYLTITGCTTAALALSVVASARWSEAQSVDQGSPEQVVEGYRTVPDYDTVPDQTNSESVLWNHPAPEKRAIAKLPSQKGEQAWTFRGTTDKGDAVSGEAKGRVNPKTGKFDGKIKMDKAVKGRLKSVEVSPVETGQKFEGTPVTGQSAAFSGTTVEGQKFEGSANPVVVEGQFKGETASGTSVSGTAGANPVGK